VRGVTLCILLGTALFQAITKNYHSPWSHLIVIALSTLSIVVAGLLRVRIFAAVGLFCFSVDIIAVIYIILRQQETFTVLAVGLILVGSLILTGYILYRKNKTRVDELLARIKQMFASWE
jgi:hypothetical protein